MDRGEIGSTLAGVRNGRGIEAVLSDYAVQSIEESRSSYPVSNLTALCDALGVQLIVEDSTTGEKYPVDSVEDCHAVIGFLMDRYETDVKEIHRATGTHYTPPRGTHQPLSIDTLIDVCGALRCNLSLLIRK